MLSYYDSECNFQQSPFLTLYKALHLPVSTILGRIHLKFFAHYAVRVRNLVKIPVRVRITEE